MTLATSAPVNKRFGEVDIYTKDGAFLGVEVLGEPNQLGITVIEEHIATFLPWHRVTRMDMPDVNLPFGYKA